MTYPNTSVKGVFSHANEDLCATIAWGSNHAQKLLKCELATIVLDRYIDNPQNCDKKAAAIMFPADSNVKGDHDSTTRFAYLWGDIDDGNYRLDDIARITKEVVPGRKAYIYASKSSTVAMKRWRILIPLVSGVSEHTFKQAQGRLVRLLAKRDVISDPCVMKPTQGLYLPNTGNHYQSLILDGDLLFIENMIEPVAAVKPKPKLAPVPVARKPNATPTDMINYINRTVSMHDLLAEYGYTRRGDKYRHTNSSTGNFSGIVFKENVYYSKGTNDPLYNGGVAVNVYTAMRLLMGKDAAFKRVIELYRT